jgi:hypothetical protein
MAVTIHVNGKSNSLSHKGGMGFTKSTLPDVCKTPSPGGPVPIPYPVIVSMTNSLKKGSKKVKVDGGNSAAIKGSEFSRCNGDEPGTAGGVKSSTNMKEATWILYSFDVKIEGKNACRLSDKMMMNHGNTACLGGHFIKPVGLSYDDSKLWDECKELHERYDELKKEQAKIMDDEYQRLHDACSGKRATRDEVFSFIQKVEARHEVVRKLHRDRQKYIDKDCDKFDWDGPKTEAERRGNHEIAANDTLGQVRNMGELLKKTRNLL